MGAVADYVAYKNLWREAHADEVVLLDSGYVYLPVYDVDSFFDWGISIGLITRDEAWHMYDVGHEAIADWDRAAKMAVYAAIERKYHE